MNLTYDDYTITNAILYKNFKYHYHQATTRETIGFVSRFKHIVLMALEFTPVIGHIIAIIESIFIRLFTQKPESKPDPQPQVKKIIIKPISSVPVEPEPVEQTNPPIIHLPKPKPKMVKPKHSWSVGNHLTVKNIVFFSIGIFAIIKISELVLHGNKIEPEDHKKVPLNNFSSSQFPVNPFLKSIQQCFWKNSVCTSDEAPPIYKPYIPQRFWNESICTLDQAPLSERHLQGLQNNAICTPDQAPFDNSTLIRTIENLAASVVNIDPVKANNVYEVGIQNLITFKINIPESISQIFFDSSNSSSNVTLTTP